MKPAIERTKQYIREHFSEDVSLRELSVVSNLSLFYLVRTFRKEVGLAPHEYLVQVRIDEARRLLREGRPIVEVAQDTGFSDQSHFTRSFKSRLGITPGRYKKGAGWKPTAPTAGKDACAP
jgi:AraC-like DNA-binding protein